MKQSANTWLFMGYSLTRLLLMKIVLVGAIWVLGPVIDNIVEPRFVRFALVDGESASAAFVRISSISCSMLLIPPVTYAQSDQEILETVWANGIKIYLNEEGLGICMHFGTFQNRYRARALEPNPSRESRSAKRRETAKAA